MFIFFTVICRFWTQKRTVFCFQLSKEIASEIDVELFNEKILTLRCKRFLFISIAVFDNILHRLINIALCQANLYAFKCIVEINQAAKVLTQSG